MGYEVKNHILFKDGKPVAQKPSPNRGGVIKPQYLVIHYTGALSAQGAINTLTSKAAKVSAHFVIAQDGTVTQCLPCNIYGWHAGESKWGRLVGMNNHSIGIEHANAGLLARTGTGGFAARLEHKAIAAKDVILAKHKNGGSVEPWQAYDPRQIEASIGVAQALHAAYGFKDILGHDDIAPGRKIDPGPAWPMAPYVSRVMGRA